MNNDIYKKGLVVVLIITLIIMASVGVKMASKDHDIISDNFHENKQTDEVEGSIKDVDLLNESNEQNNEQNAKIIVDVEGAVKNPGVYEFNEGDRVNDAINKAGGLMDHACIKNINKARKLIDGEKIYIISEGEEITDIENNGDSVYNNMAESQNSDKIDINTASKDVLMSLDGIGEVYAKRIIDYREKTKFKTVEDIKKIDGIGDKTYEKIKDYITVKWKFTVVNNRYKIEEIIGSIQQKS